MDNMDIPPVKQRCLNDWTRKYLNGFWLIVVVSFLAECSGMFFTPQPNLFAYFVQYILVPTCLLIVILTAGEIVFHFLKSGFDYFLVATGTLFVAVLIYLHPKVDFIQMLVLLPLLMSAISFRKRLVLGAGLLNTAVFFLLTLYDPVLNGRTSSFDMVVMTAALIVAALIALSISQRGTEIRTLLEQESDEKRSLLLKTIIMDKLTKTDALTELNNHISFHEYLDNLLKKSGEDGIPVHLAIIDIDNFKDINDAFGHQAGDLVLKRVARVIGETADSNDFAARYGGEEFAVIFRGKSFEAAYAATETIRVNISQMHHLELDGKSVTVSIGLHSFKSGMSKNALFDFADTSLYKAKHTGKNKTITERDPSSTFHL